MIDFILRNKITQQMIIVQELKKKAVLGLSWGESKEIQGVKMEAKSFCKGGKGSTKFKARNIGGIVVKFGIVYDIFLFFMVEYHAMSNRFFGLVILFDKKCLLDVFAFFNSPIYIVKSRLV